MTQSSLFACTRDQRVVRLDRRDDTWSAVPILEGEPAQCVAAKRSLVLVGTNGHGLLLSRDGGGTWQRVELPEAHVFSVAISPADGALYAGTEPSRVFVSRDGETWGELEALQHIPSRDRWSFPPRPWTHHVRWIAPDPHDAKRLLVAIELGGVMLSEDGGATFSDHRPGAKLDGHSVVWHPSSPGRAYEAGGDGAAASGDGGHTWTAADAGRDLPYCWAVAADVADPDRWYVSAASGPGAAHAGVEASGRLYRWDGNWHPVALPDDAMPYALVTTDDELVAGLADGRVLSSGDRGHSWQDSGVEVGSILALASAR